MRGESFQQNGHHGGRTNLESKFQIETFKLKGVLKVF